MKIAVEYEGETWQGTLTRVTDQPEPPPPPPTNPIPGLPATFGHGVPNFAYEPTIVSVQSGSAADPATFGGRVPGLDDRVRIEPRHVVTIAPGEELKAHAVGIWGELVQRGTLYAKDVQPFEYGEHRGRWTLYDGAHAIIRDRPASDPSQWGTGIVNLADWIAEGATRTQRADATGNLIAGQTAIELQTVPPDWRIGDRLSIPRTTPGGQLQNERNAIKDIQGRIVELVSPLKHPHPAILDADGNVVCFPIVANLSRGITIESENPNGTRAHTVSVGHGRQHLTGVEFLNVSRTLNTNPGEITQDPTASQHARYGVHYHHNHATPSPTDATFDARANVVRNCVIDIGDANNDLRWAMSIHQTHDTETTDNTFVGTAIDALLVTEDGNEARNVIADNLFIGGNATGTSTKTIGKHVGRGLWLYGVRNEVRGNFFAGLLEAVHIGFAGHGRKLIANLSYPLNPFDPHGDHAPSIERETSPIAFDDNSFLSCPSFLTTYFIGPFEANRLNAFECLSAGICYYTHKNTYNDLRSYGTAKFEIGLVIGAADAREINLVRPVCHGFGEAFYARQKQGGVMRLIEPDFRALRVNMRVSPWGFGGPFDGTLGSEGGAIETHIIDPRFGGVAGSPAPVHVLMDRHRYYSGRFNRVFLQEGAKAHRLYWREQAPDWTWPDGRTNQQRIDAGEAPFAGELAPCAGARAGIDGFACESL